MNRAFLVCVTLLAAACPVTPPPISTSGITVKGEVSDAFYKTPLNGAEICIIEPELGCTSTDVTGKFYIPNVPRGSQILLRFIKNGYYPNIAHYTVGQEDEYLTYLLTSDELSDLAANVAGVTRDDGKGLIIFAARTDRGSSAMNVEGISLVLSPTAGEGPFYADSEGVLSRDRTQTTDVGGGVIFNIPEGEYTLRYAHGSATCVPYYSWASGEPNTVKVRIRAGFSTYTNQVCTP